MFLLAALLFASAPPLDQPACGYSRGNVLVNLPADIDPAIRFVAIVRAGKWRTLVDERHHLVPFEPGTRRLSLPTSTQRAVDARDGEARIVRAFPARGTYRIVFSDNLETEEENMSALSCTVRVP